MSRGTVGCIGLGRMGLAMARRLLQQGWHVVGCDPAAAARADLRAAGGELAGTAREVADAAVVVLACLPSAAVSQAVLRGPDGLLAGSTVQVHVECSTIGPQAMRGLAQELATRDIALLDAPISGGPPAALEGRLATVLAGSEAARLLARPILETLATSIVEAGPQPGQAQVFKLVNQGLTFASFLLTAEAMAAGVKAGADPVALLRFLNAGTARNWATTVKFPQGVLPRRFGDGNLDIVRKDMAMYLDLCRESGVPHALGAQADALFALADTLLPAPVDLASAVRLYELAAGIEIRAAASRPAP